MKEYTNGELTVQWNPEKCIHARECVKGLPKVFSHESKPWIVKNGPFLVEGDCPLIDPEGKEAEVRGPYALCRCGGSNKKPLCDGTHIKIGFDDNR